MRVDVVCFENPLTFTGGVEVHTVELVRALREEGLDARLVTRTPDDGEPDETPWDAPTTFVDAGLPRGPLPSYHHARLVRPLFHRRAARACAGADVVHSQDDAGMGSLGDVPVVCTVHTDVVSEYEAAKKPLPWGFPQRVAVSWDVLRWRRYASQVAASIAVSPGTARRMRQELGMDPFVVPNGIPEGVQAVDHEAAREAVDAPFERTVLFLGRLAPVKRPDRVLEALAHLPEDVGLLVGGRGEMDDDLEARIRELGLGDRVRMLGFVPEEDKLATMAAADAFVLPSEHEGQPISLLEALAQGTPVVVSDIGWLPEALHPYAHEAPVRSDPERLARALEDAMARGRLKDVPVPSWRDVARETRKVYDAVL